MRDIIAWIIGALCFAVPLGLLLLDAHATIRDAREARRRVEERGPFIREGE